MAREMDVYRNLRRSPRNLLDVSRGLNRMFDEWFADPTSLMGGGDAFTAGPVQDIDIDESESHYILSLDMPGVPRDNIDIEVTGNRLHVTAERRMEGRGRRAVSREESRFEQTLLLPQGIDSSQIEADYRDGVLRIAIPKGELSKSRRVEVGSGEGKGFFSRLKNTVGEAFRGSDETTAEGKVPVHGEESVTRDKVDTTHRPSSGKGSSERAA